MLRANSILRSSLICLLILSVGMVGICSQPVLAGGHTSCGNTETGSTTVRSCCCPNCDGRCGGACCKQNSTKPVQPQCAGRSEESKHNTVVLVVEIGSLASSANAAGTRHGDRFSFDGSQAVVSLQSQHVRIQT